MFTIRKRLIRLFLVLLSLWFLAYLSVSIGDYSSSSDTADDAIQRADNSGGWKVRTPQMERPRVAVTATAARRMKKKGIVGIVDMGGGEEELEALVKQAESELKVFVYTLPSWIQGQRGPAQDPNFCYNLAMDPTFFPNNETRLYYMPEQKFPEYYSNVSATRTTNPDEADIFIVPHDYICMTFLAYKHLEGVKSSIAILNWVKEQPTFKRRGGRDHVFIFLQDNGVFCDWWSNSGAILGHHVQPMIVAGNFGQDRGMPGCFRVGQDIVIPQFHDKAVLTDLTATRGHDGFFRGWIQPSEKCGARAREFVSKIPEHVGPERFLYNEGSVADAYFGFAPAGHACWSTRLYDTIMKLSIPVIVADEAIEPFERFLDWEKFSVKILASEVLPKGTASEEGWFMNKIHNFTHQFEENLKVTGGNEKQMVAIDYVAQKRAALLNVQPWFQWDEHAEKSAFKLFTVELWCRTDKGRDNKFCQNPTSVFADKGSYF